MTANTKAPNVRVVRIDGKLYRQPTYVIGREHREMITLRQYGVPRTEVSARYKVTPATVSRITHRYL